MDISVIRGNAAKPPMKEHLVRLEWVADRVPAFAMGAALCAGLLPARKAADVQPVDILRGAQ